MDLRRELNAAQYEAVTYLGGPLLVIAGAGSGKTRVLTYRIAYLIEKAGVAPSQILAVTFTNKAAQEMRERIEERVGHAAASALWMGTFHSFCVQILRRHAQHIGYSTRFTIFDTADQLSAVRTCIKELNLDPAKYDARSILVAISKAKNERIGPSAYLDAAFGHWERTVGRVYRAYDALLAQAQALDFDDLLVKTVDLFEKAPDVLARYQTQFQHILVDEYQDTNRVQYLIVEKLAARHRNLCVVGDADQSIYKFRGADIRNILDFERDYPDAKVIKLEENYRSTQHILEAANAVIENNLDRPAKKLYTRNEPGHLVGVYEAEDERDEAAFLCDEVDRLQREEGFSLQDIAVLYRTHAQSRSLEDEFLSRGVKYRIVSGLRFYERKEIKDILSYLRVAANPDDVLSLQRIINVPKRSIGEGTVGKLQAYATEHDISLYQAITHVEEIDDLSAAQKKRVGEFHALLQAIIAQGETSSITDLTRFILDATGYMAELQQDPSIEAQARIENLREFVSLTTQFESDHPGATLFDFLEHVALISDVDTLEDDAEGITLMTLHSAKGLEFPVVFMVGMEEGIFPHSRSQWDAGELEEERRLCYVGMTRAMRRLYMTYARSRLLFGQRVYSRPSQFIAEIPPALVDDLSSRRSVVWGGGGRRVAAASYGGKTERFAAKDGASPRPQPTHGTAAIESASTFAPGDRVRHPKWGVGTVVTTEQAGGDTVLTMAFPGLGIKKIMVGIVPLERL